MALSFAVGFASCHHRHGHGHGHGHCDDTNGDDGDGHPDLHDSHHRDADDN